MRDQLINRFGGAGERFL